MVSEEAEEESKHVLSSLVADNRHTNFRLQWFTKYSFPQYFKCRRKYLTYEIMFTKKLAPVGLIIQLKWQVNL